jgi:putative heme-binding domain-containing protein
MYGMLFSAQHNSRKVQRHALESAGSTFTTSDHDFVTCDDPDFHPSDVLEAPDGSLLVVDTGAWYVQHCPTGRIRNSRAPGGVWRVRAAAPPDPERKRAIEAQEREAAERWALDPAALIARLGGTDGRLAARALAARGDRSAAAALVEQLRSTGANVRLAAAEALAACGTAESVPALWSALEGEVDPHFEHAVVYAIHRLADRAALERALPHAHPRIRKAAMILLSQPPHPREALPKDAVMARVSAADPELRQAAIRILQQRKEWAPEAVGLLRSWLGKESLSEEERAGLRGSFLAFQADPAVQEAVGRALREPGTARRLLLLGALAETTLKEFPKAWGAAFLETIVDPDPAVRLATVRAVALHQVAAFDDLLLLVGSRPAEGAAIRLEALRAVVSRRPGLPEATIDFLVAQVASGGESVARLAAAEVLRRARLDEPALARVLAAIRADGLVSPSLFAPALREAKGAALEEAAASIRAGWRPSPAELGPAIPRLPADAQDLLQKAAEEQRAKVERFEPLARGGDAARGRAVFFGKKVACGSCHAVGAEGGRVGPDLTKIGAIRSSRDLLESILVPSSTFAQGYESYLVATQDGDVRTGVLARQSSDAVVLRDASGGEVQIRRDRVREMRRAEKSVMPEGLERALSETEFRDLLAYLQSLR